MPTLPGDRSPDYRSRKRMDLQARGTESEPDRAARHHAGAIVASLRAWARERGIVGFRVALPDDVNPG